MGYLVGHFDRCTGCGICQLTCSVKFHGGFNPRLGNLDIRMTEEGLVHHPVVCHQCSNAFCKRVCPKSAITRSSSTGALEVDHELCIGCGLCATICPLCMIRMIDKKAFKCNLCQGDPKCVSTCPAGAIELVAVREN